MCRTRVWRTGKRFLSSAFSASVRCTSIFSGRSVVEILRLDFIEFIELGRDLQNWSRKINKSFFWLYNRFSKKSIDSLYCFSTFLCPLLFYPAIL